MFGVNYDFGRCRYLCRSAALAASCLLAISLGSSSLTAGEHDPVDNEWPFNRLTDQQDPAVPEKAAPAWTANPIDRFILARLHEEGLEPSRQTDKRTLLRRVTFDLTGMLPTPAEQEAFLADDSPDAYAKVVDRLLGSLRYGERWAQHWLDLVRYAETDGFKSDFLRPNAFKYRDYVIRALNEDLTYDRFVAQQIAGDELEPNNPQAIIATGLNRLYPDELQASNLVQRRQEYLDDITDVTGLTFLGLTLGCARCHDHKFDPILQTDYYQLQAFFAGIVPRDDITVATEDERQKYNEAADKWEAATADIRSEMDKFFKPYREAKIKKLTIPLDDETKAALATQADDRTALQETLVVQAYKFFSIKTNYEKSDLEPEEVAPYEKLETQLARFEVLKPRPLEQVLAVAECDDPPPATHRLATGNFLKPLEEVRPGFPKFLEKESPDISPPPGVNSSGRRSALARWLIEPDHPLTARLMMNRLWQYHFGEGIVPTANDFGAMGEPPSHRELLDWLADEFVDRHWSLKAMHRLMVTSAAYCQSSDVDPRNPVHMLAQKKDHANKLLWHARRRRLEGEAIRDGLLQIAGRLNLRMYGPSARPQLPEGLPSDVLWQPDAKAEDRNRRSIYVFAKRNLRFPLLDAFDLPDLHNSCARRTKTTTAPQALTLLNGEFALEQARYWSGSLLSRFTQDDGELVTTAYREIFGREPGADELAGAQRFIELQTSRIASGGKFDSLLPIPNPPNVSPAKAAAVMDFCHALMNANEFLYVD